MEVLVPIALSDAMVTSLTAGGTALLEDSTPVWAAGTFAVDDLRHRVQTHRVYRCVKAHTTAGGVAPENDSTANWQDLRPTNRWSMFDGSVATQTVGASPLVIKLQPSFFNGLALFGLDGVTISVVVKDAPDGATVFSTTESLESGNVGDWYEYFFAPFKPRTDFLVSDLQPFAGSEVTITITGPGTVKAGVLAIGDQSPFGDSLSGARAELVDYSYIAIDEFGNNVIKKRRNSKDMAVRVLLSREEANRVSETMADLLAVPCVYIASKKGSDRALRVYGLGSGSISFDHPGHCVLDHTVKGLI